MLHVSEVTAIFQITLVLTEFFLKLIGTMLINQCPKFNGHPAIKIGFIKTLHSTKPAISLADPFQHFISE
jgi:hypothetical protein